MGDLGDEFGPRFLTPCSDDMTQGMVHPAAIEGGKNGAANAFASILDGDLFDGSLTNSPAFSAFEAYDFSACSDGTSQNISDMSTTQPLEWDDRFTDPQLF